MSDLKTSPDSDGLAPSAQKLAAHRLFFTTQQAIKNSYAVWLISFFVAIAAWGKVPAWLCLGWPLAVGMAYTARVRLLRGASDRHAVEAKHAYWRRRFIVATLGCALVVAIGPALFFPAVSETARMYMTLLLCCWLAGSMASIGTFAGLFASYAAVFMGGIATGWLISDTPWKLQIVIMLALYGIVVTGFGRGFARLVSEGVEIRFVNEQLMAQVAAAREVAEASSAAKSRFLAAASHDLRQPLHAVAMLNGLLARPQSPQSVAEISRHMGRSLATLQRLFGSVLDYSRLEAVAIKPALTWVRLPDLLDRLVTDYQPVATQKGLMLRHDCADVEIRTDEQILERILRNLLENALKFTDRGTVGLTAAFAGEVFIVAVADSGPGVPANLKADIFKEYFQACDSKKEEGLGLGLAIVRHLAASLDLSINVRDNAPQGAVFELAMPLDRVRAARESPRESQVELPPADLAEMLVLCIDDDEASLRALRALLEDWNARVLVAKSPEEAFAAAARSPRIEVILSDYELGADMNGADLILALRERLGPVSGAILTGSAAAIQAHRAGDIEFPVLMKPVATEELRALLETFKGML